MLFEGRHEEELTDREIPATLGKQSPCVVNIPLGLKGADTKTSPLNNIPSLYITRTSG